MPAGELNTLQRAVILTLMVAGREVTNPELQATYGLKLDGKDRRRLNDAKLVSSRRVGRAFAHELTDAGWHACLDELSAAPPRAPGSLGYALYAVLGGLGTYLDRSQLRLADVFGDAGATAAGRGAAPAPAVEAAIRAAYRALVTRPRGWVGLADLRPRLGEVERADIDAALKAMNRRPGVNLVPESNQKALTAEDRGAAVRVGGEDKHLISIEDA